MDQVVMVDMTAVATEKVVVVEEMVIEEVEEVVAQWIKW